VRRLGALPSPLFLPTRLFLSGPFLWLLSKDKGLWAGWLTAWHFLWLTLCHLGHRSALTKLLYFIFFYCWWWHSHNSSLWFHYHFSWIRAVLFHAVFLVAPISLPVGLFGSLSALPIPCKLQSLGGLSSLQPCCRGCISKERGSLALCHPVQQHCPFSSCLAQSSSWWHWWDDGAIGGISQVQVIRSWQTLQLVQNKESRSLPSNCAVCAGQGWHGWKLLMPHSWHCHLQKWLIAARKPLWEYCACLLSQKDMSEKWCSSILHIFTYWCLVNGTSGLPSCTDPALAPPLPGAGPPAHLSAYRRGAIHFWWVSRFKQKWVCPDIINQENNQ